MCGTSPRNDTQNADSSGLLGRRGGSPHCPPGAKRKGAACKAEAMEPGERMLLWCDGGPSMGRAVFYPPPFEIEVDEGIYVLVDDGPIEDWHDAFVSSSR